MIADKTTLENVVKTCNFSVAIFLASAFFSGLSHAALVTINVNGTVTQVTANLPSISLGDSFSGAITFDDASLVDLNPDPNLGVYALDLQSAVFNVGGHVLQADDVFGVSSFNDGVNIAQLIAEDFTTMIDGQSFANGVFGSSSPVDDSFDAIVNAINSDGEVIFQGGGAAFRADISSLSVEISEVPLPATAWLFGSALLGVAGLRLKQN